MPALGDLVAVTHRYGVANQVVQNVYGFRCDDATSTFAELAGDLATATNGLAKMMQNMRDNVDTIDIAVRSVHPSTAAEYVLASGTLPGGTVTSGGGGDLLPPQSAMVIKWTTGLAGRSYRDRTYLSGFGELGQDAGTWATGYVTGTDTNVAAFLARYKDGGVFLKWSLVIISRELNGAVRPVPIGTDVTGYAVRATVFNQRRRTVGVGS